MPKRPDVNEIAARIVAEATGEEQPEAAPVPEPSPAKGKNPAAVALGRLGGRKGGKARSDTLTPERRQEIARAAAAARWKRSA